MIIGVIKEFHRSDTILLDFDGHKPSFRTVSSVLHSLGIVPRWIRQDRTRHGWHIVIRHNHKLQPAETIAIQTLCGSDPKRELLNLRRVISLGKHPSRYALRRANILFSEKL